MGSISLSLRRKAVPCVSTRKINHLEKEMSDFRFASTGPHSMGGWEACGSKYGYAATMERIVRERIPVGRRILMLGLGGGVLCSLLDDYDMTVVELDANVYDEARRMCFPKMEACGPCAEPSTSDPRRRAHHLD